MRNRYSDAERRTAQAIDALCRELGLGGQCDALWDHLFEQPLPSSELWRSGCASTSTRCAATSRGGAARRATARGVHGGLDRGGRAGPRADGPVVVVCGGFHAPALRALAAREAGAPDVPRAAEPGRASARSYLVPYSFRRLDSFAGYESGMPSPEFYQAVWEHGPEQAAGSACPRVVARLRGRGQHVSSADLIAASRMADGLARLRGHCGACARSTCSTGWRPRW